VYGFNNQNKSMKKGFLLREELQEKEKRNNKNSLIKYQCAKPNKTQNLPFSFVGELELKLALLFRSFQCYYYVR
jgi:hypothetical protein